MMPQNTSTSWTKLSTNLLLIRDNVKEISKFKFKKGAFKRNNKTQDANPETTLYKITLKALKFFSNQFSVETKRNTDEDINEIKNTILNDLKIHEIYLIKTTFAASQKLSDLCHSKPSSKGKEILKQIIQSVQLTAPIEECLKCETLEPLFTSIFKVLKIEKSIFDTLTHKVNPLIFLPACEAFQEKLLKSADLRSDEALLILIKNDITKPMLRSTCVKGGFAETFNFVEQVQQFKVSSPQEKEALRRAIIDRYVRIESLKEININDAVRKNILEAKSENMGLFDEAVAAMSKLLRENL